MDSAVAALRLIGEGRSLETATAQLWPGTDRRSCCSPGALQRAARTAAYLGLPHHVVDLETEFEDAVVGPFRRGYLGGETPNPCVDCNPMRLAALASLAAELGLARVATGHYARLVWRDGEPFVARAVDRRKDQSYMLWAVPPDVLARLEFPLGGLTKTRCAPPLRRPGWRWPTSPRARKSASPSRATSRSSRRAASSPRGGHRRRRRRGRGRHQGHWRFTVGQRRGIGVSAAEPLYVLERRAAENEVVVGGRDELDVGGVRVGDVVDRGLGDGMGSRSSSATGRPPSQSPRSSAAMPRSWSRLASRSRGWRRVRRPSSTVTTWWSAAAASRHQRRAGSDHATVSAPPAA